MNKIKNLLSKLKNISRFKYIMILLVLLLAATISFPTLARYKNRLNIENILSTAGTWDGTIATSYKKGSGTVEDPYIISNAKEFAYFQSKLTTTTYKNTYFKLENDIVINNGLLNYENSNITYTINDQKVYIKANTNEVYTTNEFSGDAIGTINNFPTIENFEGFFDGDYHTVYGLYMTSTEKDLALFKNLQGTVENLYLENTFIYGGSNTSALAANLTNAKVKDIFVSGNIIGTKNDYEEKEELIIPNITYTKDINPLEEEITLPTLTTENITNIKLTGTYTSTDETQKIKLNETEYENGEFTIDFGTTPLEKISLLVEDELETTITLTNLVYEFTYKTSYTSGILGRVTSSNISNLINKANVTGNAPAGLISKMTDTSLENAYNTGTISGTTATGLINLIKNSTANITINKVYNAGTLTATTTKAFVNELENNQNIKISNSFNTVPTTSSYETTSSVVTLENVLDVNTNIEGTTQKTIEDLKDKNYLINTLTYNEYVDSITLAANNTAAWVYEIDYLPTLYFDDLNNPIINLTVGTYNWNDLGFELRKIFFTDRTAFQVSSVNPLNPIKEAAYYIHNSNIPLTKEEILNITSWTTYENIVNLTTEGYYIIYVKALDNNDNIYYANSEQIVVDLNPPIATIKVKDKVFNTFETNLSNINVSEDTNVNITVEDKFSEVKEIKYYLSNIFLTQDELKDIEIVRWTDYNGLTINAKGTYVVNIKTTDALGHVAYYNTDYIVYNGFEETLSLGREVTIQNKLNITSNSHITYNFSYQDQINFQDTYKTNLVVNYLLPKNTKLTLLDHNTNEIFTYQIPTSDDNYNYEISCNTEGCPKYATYPLDLFTKVGQLDNTLKFNHKTFIEESTKNLSVIIDFSNAEVTNNFTLKTHLELHDGNEVILSTLKPTIKEVNVYKDNDSDLAINLLNPVSIIDLTKTTITEVDLETFINYKTINNEPIYDTTRENASLALAIKLVNQNSELIPRKYLKNVVFQLGENTYTADNDGIIRINIANNLVKTTTKLLIKTTSAQTKLATGNYNFVITPYVAYDGKYSSNMNSHSKVLIPVTTTKTDTINYGFNVILDNNDKVLYKKDNLHNMNFTIVNENIFANPIIKVSLHKKEQLTAYNQNYEIIDLQDYTVDELIKLEDNIYSVTTPNLDISLNTSKFEKTGYEFKFDLYDGDKFITSIKKRFIIK